MATHAKTYETRLCVDCWEERTVRTDSPSLRCGSCAKKGRGNPNYGNVKFTGTITEYKRYHARVYRKYGKASKCINGCIANRYHWANISGNFEDPDDYQEMCPTCHSRFDRKGE